MESFKVNILGCGSAKPTLRHYPTSQVVDFRGNLFMIDCGEGTQISLRSLNLKWKKVSAVFVSHTHADHITGIPGLLMLSAQVDRDEPLIIVGPPKIKEYIETSRRVLDMYINYEIIVKEISDPLVPGEVFRRRFASGTNLLKIPARGFLTPRKPKLPVYRAVRFGPIYRKEKRLSISGRRR